MPFNLLFIKEMKKKYDELENLFKKTKEEFKQTKEELKEKERKISQIKEESNQIKSEDKQYAKSIVAAGHDEFNQLGVNSNNRYKWGDYTVLQPPQNLPVEPSSLNLLI